MLYPIGVSILPLLLIILPFVASAQWNEELTPSPGCEKIGYIAGAGVRMRMEPRTESKIAGALRYQAKVCRHSLRDEWIEVSLGPQEPRGWISGSLVTDVLPSPHHAISQMFEEQSMGNYAAAIGHAERVLESKLFEGGARQREILERISFYYEKVGDASKATEYIDRSKKERSSRWKIGGVSDSRFGLFDRWFLERFAYSSRYEDGYDTNQYRVQDIAIVLDEVSVQDSTASLLAIEKRMPGFWGKIYIDAFANSSSLNDGKLRNRLKGNTTLVEAALTKRSDVKISGISTRVLDALPGEILKEERIFDYVMRNCEANDIGKSWRRLPQEKISSHVGKVLICVGDEELEEIGKSHPVLRTVEALLAAVGLGASKERLAAIYALLPDAKKKESRAVDMLIGRDVDIYKFLPETIRSQTRIRKYAGRVSSCNNLVEVNPSDREIFLAAAARLTEVCVRAMAPGLRQDRSFAQEVLRVRPEIVSGFDETIQKDGKVFDALLARAGDSSCPYSKLPADFPLPYKARLAKKSRWCLIHFDTSDFLEPEIYKAVVSGGLDYEVLKKLPQEFKKDPSIMFVLPADIFGFEQEEIFKTYTSDANLTEAVKLWGIISLSRVTAFKYDGPPSESYAHRYLWSPAHNISPSFWTTVFSLSRGRGDTCGDWEKLIVAWRLNQTKSDHPMFEPDMVPSVEFPLDDFNKLFSCQFQKKDYFGEIGGG